MGIVKSHFNVVCHQIQSPDNLGAVARVMANFGFGHLRLSQPVTDELEKAYKMAVGADFILEKTSFYKDLRLAVEDCVYAVGTTSRHDVRRRTPLSPREGMRRLAQASLEGRVALVLGGERRGLSDEELNVCQDVVAISTSDIQPSMNLAQAATVFLYLAAEQEDSTPVELGTRTPRVELRSLQALEARWKNILLEVGYLNPQAPDYVLGELVRTWERAQLNQREAELWLSATQHLLRVVKK